MNRAALVGIVAALAIASPAAAADIVGAVRAACDARNFALAEREIQTYRATVGVTPDMLEALSWLARGELDAREIEQAARYADETRELSLGMLKHGGNMPPPLAIALGAAIEVRAQVLAAQGQRGEAITFLRTELASWRQTPIAARIQKNINLLTLVGKPAPPLDEARWLGQHPPPLTALKGHAVLLFFWAHWCSDCKAEVPILARLMATYGPQELVLLGPTQLYGYTAEGDAPPDAETRYIEQVQRQFYAPLAGMAVPLSSGNFQRYGCSTTPTLVLLDKSGVVRLYHPGAMTYAMLEEQIRLVLGVHSRS